MKFLHLSDLHLGKSIYGVSLLDNGDQPAWAERFLSLAQEIKPDAVVIAGDIYDRSAPSEDAVGLLDRMVTALAEMEIPVMMVAGNHDSGRRLSFGGSLLAKQKIHIAGTISEQLPCVTLADQYGPVNFWLMPYIFPALVARRLGDESIRDYDTAVRRLLARQNIDFAQRNVLVAHQNVTANGQEALRGGSESMVGGVGQVDCSAFDGFDYVALGHIHAAYPVGREAVRYAGSPLCYHFGETRQPVKGPLLVELGAKGAALSVKTQVIAPLHPMREIRGSCSAIQAAELQNRSRGEYVHVVLTDQRPSPETYRFFRDLFESRDSILMEMISEYDQFSPVSAAVPGHAQADKPVEELFLEFCSQRCGGAAPDGGEQELLWFVGEQVRHMDQTDDARKRQCEAVLKFALEQEEIK